MKTQRSDETLKLETQKNFEKNVRFLNKEPTTNWLIAIR